MKLADLKATRAALHEAILLAERTRIPRALVLEQLDAARRLIDAEIDAVRVRELGQA